MRDKIEALTPSRREYLFQLLFGATSFISETLIQEIYWWLKSVTSTAESLPILLVGSAEQSPSKIKRPLGFKGEDSFVKEEDSIERIQPLFDYPGQFVNSNTGLTALKTVYTDVVQSSLKQNLKWVFWITLLKTSVEAVLGDLSVSLFNFYFIALLMVASVTLKGILSFLKLEFSIHQLFLLQGVDKQSSEAMSTFNRSEAICQHCNMLRFSKGYFGDITTYLFGLFSLFMLQNITDALPLPLYFAGQSATFLCKSAFYGELILSYRLFSEGLCWRHVTKNLRQHWELSIAVGASYVFMSIALNHGLFLLTLITAGSSLIPVMLMREVVGNGLFAFLYVLELTLKNIVQQGALEIVFLKDALLMAYFIGLSKHIRLPALVSESNRFYFGALTQFFAGLGLDTSTLYVKDQFTKHGMTIVKLVSSIEKSIKDSLLLQHLKTYPEAVIANPQTKSKITERYFNSYTKVFLSDYKGVLADQFFSLLGAAKFSFHRVLDKNKAYFQARQNLSEDVLYAYVNGNMTAFDLFSQLPENLLKINTLTLLGFLIGSIEQKLSIFATIINKFCQYLLSSFLFVFESFCQVKNSKNPLMIPGKIFFSVASPVFRDGLNAGYKISQALLTDSYFDKMLLSQLLRGNAGILLKDSIAAPALIEILVNLVHLTNKILRFRAQAKNIISLIKKIDDFFSQKKVKFICWAAGMGFTKYLTLHGLIEAGDFSIKELLSVLKFLNKKNRELKFDVPVLNLSVEKHYELQLLDDEKFKRYSKKVTSFQKHFTVIQKIKASIPDVFLKEFTEFLKEEVSEKTLNSVKAIIFSWLEKVDPSLKPLVNQLLEGPGFDACDFPEESDLSEDSFSLSADTASFHRFFPEDTVIRVNGEQITLEIDGEYCHVSLEKSAEILSPTPVAQNKFVADEDDLSEEEEAAYAEVRTSEVNFMTGRSQNSFTGRMAELSQKALAMVSETASQVKKESSNRFKM